MTHKNIKVLQKHEKEKGKRTALNNTKHNALLALS